MHLLFLVIPLLALLIDENHNRHWQTNHGNHEAQQLPSIA